MRACAVLALMFSISTQAVRAQALASQPVNAAAHDNRHCDGGLREAERTLGEPVLVSGIA